MNKSNKNEKYLLSDFLLEIKTISEWLSKPGPSKYAVFPTKTQERYEEEKKKRETK